jgi:hypothetical protein
MSQCRDACGPHQLGNGIAGGIEALVHTIRGELESHIDHSLIALDSANAFNSLSPHSAYEAVVKHIPELRYYAYHVLAHHSKVAFHVDGRCFVQRMERGVMQGSSISGLIFNLTQADPITRIRNLLQALILSLHDDHTFSLAPNTCAGSSRGLSSLAW